MVGTQGRNPELATKAEIMEDLFSGSFPSFAQFVFLYNPGPPVEGSTAYKKLSPLILITNQ